VESRLQVEVWPRQVTSDSAYGISKASAAPVSLIGLATHSSPTPPRGMDKITIADTANNAPPSIVARPGLRIMLVDNLYSSSLRSSR
jgi:hypothetical protein